MKIKFVFCSKEWCERQVALALALALTTGRGHAAVTSSPLRPLLPLPESALAVAVDEDCHSRH